MAQHRHRQVGMAGSKRPVHQFQLQRNLEPRTTNGLVPRVRRHHSGARRATGAGKLLPGYVASADQHDPRMAAVLRREAPHHGVEAAVAASAGGVEGLLPLEEF